jgi:hypothetical protein
MFDKRVILFSSHYMFRSAKVIVRWFYEYVCLYWIINMDPFFTFINNIITKILIFKFLCGRGFEQYVL